MANQGCPVPRQVTLNNVGEEEVATRALERVLVRIMEPPRGGPLQPHERDMPADEDAYHTLWLSPPSDTKPRTYDKRQEVSGWR